MNFKEWAEQRQTMDGYPQYTAEEAFEAGRAAANSEPKPFAAQLFDFKALIEYGLNRDGASIMNGMPWAFDFEGLPVTHENDNHYVVGEFQFKRGEFLIVVGMGNQHGVIHLQPEIVMPVIGHIGPHRSVAFVNYNLPIGTKIYAEVK